MALLFYLAVFLAKVAAVTSVTLFAAGTRGTVTSLSLALEPNGTGTLTRLHSSTECGGAPAWLTLDSDNRILYYIDDTTIGNGALHSFSIEKDGGLVHVDSIETPVGPVSSTLYSGPESQRLAVAFYHSATIGSVEVSPQGQFSSPQMIKVDLAKSGTGRQGEPHPHDAVLDPTGKFIIVPDLGSDHVRIFHISPDTAELVEKQPIDVDRGSGPRHAEFYCPDVDSACWMYLVSEIANRVTVFRVRYPSGDEMSLKEMQTTTTFGGEAAPVGTFGAAEIEISPDNRFVTVSNRQDGSFTSPRVSDSLTTYKILDDGTLEFVQLAAAGGRGPRHFSFNKDGTMVAVGLQNDGEVAILRRDLETGQVGDEIARLGGLPSVAVVVWDE